MKNTDSKIILKTINRLISYDMVFADLQKARGCFTNTFIHLISRSSSILVAFTAQPSRNREITQPFIKNTMFTANQLIRKICSWMDPQLVGQSYVIP